MLDKVRSPIPTPVSRNQKCYLVEDTFNGEPGRLDGETVDQDFVNTFTAIETRRFFINLGGTELMTKGKGGTIRCKSVSPDGKEERVVRFIPVPSGATS